MTRWKLGDTVTLKIPYAREYVLLDTPELVDWANVDINLDDRRDMMFRSDKSKDQ